MNKQEITNRLIELNKIHEPLYKEEHELRTQLAKIEFEELKEFLKGKKFFATLFENHTKLYLFNNSMSENQLFNNGVTEHHQSFYDDKARIDVNDGEVTITSSISTKELLDYAKTISVIVDFSLLNKEIDNLKSLLGILEDIVS